MKKLASTQTAILTGCAATLVTALGIGVGTPLAAQSGGLSMLSNLTKGEWTLRFRGGAERKICVRTGQELIQLRHKGGDCSRYVIKDGSQDVSVHYKCTGDGYGVTSIRRETSTLVQIDSEGIKGGQPFQLVGEARRTGTCS